MLIAVVRPGHPLRTPVARRGRTWEPVGTLGWRAVASGDAAERDDAPHGFRVATGRCRSAAGPDVELLLVGEPQRDCHPATPVAADDVAERFASVGLSAFSHLVGAFAAVLRERKTGATWLVRDRFGLVPLFHASSAEFLYCATSLAEIASAAAEGLQPDPVGLLQYYLFGQSIPPLTIYRHVRHVPPASAVEHSVEGRCHHKYVVLPTDRRHPGNGSGTSRSIADAVRRAVASDLGGSRMPGLALSGGLDSSVVAAAVPPEYRGIIRTFTLSCPDGPRPIPADAVLGPGAAPTEVVFEPDLDGSAYAAYATAEREPVCAWPLFLLSFLTRRAAGHVDRLLLGDGGDELFLGYRHQIDLVRGWVSARLAGHAPETLGRRDLTEKCGVLSRAIGWAPARSIVDHALSCLPDAPADDLNAILDTVVERELTCFPFFASGARLGAAVGVDVRCPLLHPVVVSEALALPWESVIADGVTRGVTKQPLRRAFAGSLTADAAWRPKEGFGESWPRIELPAALEDECLRRADAFARHASWTPTPLSAGRDQPGERDLRWHHAFLGLWLARPPAP